MKFFNNKEKTNKERQKDEAQPPPKQKQPVMYLYLSTKLYEISKNNDLLSVVSISAKDGMLFDTFTPTDRTYILKEVYVPEIWSSITIPLWYNRKYNDVYEFVSLSTNTYNGITQNVTHIEFLQSVKAQSIVCIKLE